MFALLAGLFACAGLSAQALAGPVAVPGELESWRGWALEDQEYRQCPLRLGASANDRRAYLCAWPERLALTLDAHSGTFSQRWQISAESWVRLPGSLEHWPTDVRVDGAEGQVVARDNAPQVLLQRGDHTISGTFRFAVRPEQLPIDSRTAMVDLTLDGKKIAQPERPEGEIWLGGRRTTDQPRLLQVEVYRLVHDEIPVMLDTDVRLQVSGDGREELLSRALPDGFVPVSLETDLPVRVEADGRLRVQVRPGTWIIRIRARGATVASKLTRPPVQGSWARDEVWSFEASDRLRVAAVQGPEGIDPTRAGVPDEWHEFPAYRLAPDSVFNVVERTRGLQNADENSLSLAREVWLDFDGGGFTERDHLSGDMRQEWRLETLAPVELASAVNHGENLLITRNGGGAGTGVEVRTPQLDLTAVSRISKASGSLPASGWNSRFRHVRGELFLPPGHLLLAVTGADGAPTTWLESWGLWAVFGVLVVAISAGWIAGKPAGAIALVGLLLLFQEGTAYIWLWGNLIAAVALARAAPEGRLKRVAAGYRVVSLVVLGLALAPFLLNEVQFALHPQLAPLAGPEGPSSGLANVFLLNKERPRVVASVTADDLEAKDVNGALKKSAATSVDNPYGLAATWQAGRAAAPAAPAGDAGTPVTAIADVAAPAPPPKGFEEVTVTGSRITNPALPNQNLDQRYAAGTQLQAGPGVPGWTYNTYPFFWSGPVESSERVHFIFIGPVLLGLWRIVGVILLTALFLSLAFHGRPGGVSGRLNWSRVLGPFRSGASAAALVLMLVCVGFTQHARAASTPDAGILDQLRQRLTKPPECLPTCADITSASVVVHDEKLDVSLTVSALTSVAVPMPVAGDRWQVDTITVDSKSALAAARNDEGSVSLSVPLTAGVHTVRLSGQLAAAESVSLAFPLRPHRVAVESTGWDVTGLNDEQRVLSGALELVRHRAAAAGTGTGPRVETLETSSEFPAFVRVTREVNFGLDWIVRTKVERVAPAKAPITVDVPLLDNESVLTQKLETHSVAGRTVAVVALARGDDEFEWASTLPRSDTLQFSLPEGQPRAEVWTFNVSPQWGVEFEGFPAVMPEELTADRWLFEFHPRPGESLKLRVNRPESAGGATLAIDHVARAMILGARSADGVLMVNYRSTMGGRHAFKLPPEARVTRVALDGTDVQLRPDHGELPISLLPGSHVIAINWTLPTPVRPVSRPPAIDLGGPASNISTEIMLPPDRWTLLAFGPGQGPAVLYWGQIVIFLVVAWLLGRWPRSPLSIGEWLILGVGLSTLSWGVFAIVALWLFAMQWRARWASGGKWWRFNLLQVLLALLTVWAVGALVFVGIHRSLLASPDMGVEGVGSSGTHLRWFLDRTVSELPQPLVVSAPMWLYRTLMFAWALWIVVALLRWLRWAWAAWKTNGIWKERPPKDAAQPTAPAQPA